MTHNVNHLTVSNDDLSLSLLTSGKVYCTQQRLLMLLHLAPSPSWLRLTNVKIHRE